MKYLPDFKFTPFDVALQESVDWFIQVRSRATRPLFAKFTPRRLRVIDHGGRDLIVGVYLTELRLGADWPQEVNSPAALCSFSFATRAFLSLSIWGVLLITLCRFVFPSLSLLQGHFLILAGIQSISLPGAAPLYAPGTHLLRRLSLHGQSCVVFLSVSHSFLSYARPECCRRASRVCAELAAETAMRAFLSGCLMQAEWLGLRRSRSAMLPRESIVIGRSS